MGAPKPAKKARLEPQKQPLIRETVDTETGWEELEQEQPVASEVRKGELRRLRCTTSVVNCRVC